MMSIYDQILSILREDIQISPVKIKNTPTPLMFSEPSLNMFIKDIQFEK